MEKLAQVDFVALTCAVELHKPEVMATEEEIQESMATSDTPPPGLQGDAMPQLTDIGIGEKPGSAGPPAARVIVEEKPRVTSHVVEGAIAALHHHMTFPIGIRERCFQVLCEEYGLTQDQSEKIGIATAQNIDGHRLPEHTLVQMDGREKLRIRLHEVKTYKDCSHLLVAPLVGSHSERGQPAKYTLPPLVEPRIGPPGSSFVSNDMTRSLPNLRGFTARNNFGRTEFRVPLSTGPLTMDPDLQKLRTTGFFIRMPPLKFS
jgi:hypothetical protein